MRIIQFFLILFLFFNSCQDLDEKCFIETEEISGTDAIKSVAIVSVDMGNVGTFNIESVGHCWAEENGTEENRNPSIENSKTNRKLFELDVQYKDTLSGLTPNTIYNFRAYAITENGSVCYGEVKQMSTNQINLFTEEPQISSQFASVLGRVISVSVEDIEEMGHCWSTQNNSPTVLENEGKSVVQPSFDGTIIFKTEINNLKNGVKYFMRSYVIIKGVVYYGDIQEFTITNVWEEPLFNNSLSKKEGAITFTLGEFAYIGLGFSNDGNENTEFIKISDNDEVIPIAKFPGNNRTGAVAFTSNNKGYVGLGVSPSCEMLEDFWMYDPITNTWDSLPHKFPGSTRHYGICYSINEIGYVGLGRSSCDGDFLNDFWQYNPNEIVKWSKIEGTKISARMGAVAFVIDDLAYIGTGIDSNGNFLNDFCGFNPKKSNPWITGIKDFRGGNRSFATGFSIDNKGYIGTGNIDAFFTQDIWQFNPKTNNWLQKASIPGAGRYKGISFVLNNKGYVGLGTNNTLLASQRLSDLYIYTPDEE